MKVSHAKHHYVHQRYNLLCLCVLIPVQDLILHRVELFCDFDQKLVFLCVAKGTVAALKLCILVGRAFLEVWVQELQVIEHLVMRLKDRFNQAQLGALFRAFLST